MGSHAANLAPRRHWLAWPPAPVLRSSRSTFSVGCGVCRDYRAESHMTSNPKHNVAPIASPRVSTSRLPSCRSIRSKTKSFEVCGRANTNVRSILWNCATTVMRSVGANWRATIASGPFARVSGAHPASSISAGRRHRRSCRGLRLPDCPVALEDRCRSRSRFEYCRT